MQRSDGSAHMASGLASFVLSEIWLNRAPVPHFVGIRDDTRSEVKMPRFPTKPVGTRRLRGRARRYMEVKIADLPERGDWSFGEDGLWAMLAGAVDDEQVGFDLWVVGDGDEAALAGGTVETAAAVGAIASAIAVG